MKYIALLRGINVGGKNKVSMQILTHLFKSLGFNNVSTYINSGNVFFETDLFDSYALTQTLIKEFEIMFEFPIPILVKEIQEMRSIAESVPNDWLNDGEQKSDVAYLFPEIDSPEILNQLPFNTDYINITYIKGAVLWNLKMEDYSKSRLNKILGTNIYRLMTVRNVNTARKLAHLS